MHLHRLGIKIGILKRSVDTVLQIYLVVLKIYIPHFPCCCRCILYIELESCKKKMTKLLQDKSIIRNS